MKSQLYCGDAIVESRRLSPIGMFRMFVGAGLAALCLFMFLGCAHYTVNQRVENYNTMASEYLTPTAEQRSDELLLVLAFSGGGTRAAALSYGVLEALNKVTIPAPETEGNAQGGERRDTLLDQVDIISSVSGGSMTAAYYALYGKQTLEDFKERFLYRNVNRALLLRTLLPVNLIRLEAVGIGVIKFWANFCPIKGL